jgi:hypothetical protein
LNKKKPCENPKEERCQPVSDLLGEEGMHSLYLQTMSNKWEGRMIDVVGSVGYFAPEATAGGYT